MQTSRRNRLRLVVLVSALLVHCHAVACSCVPARAGRASLLVQRALDSSDIAEVVVTHVQTIDAPEPGHTSKPSILEQQAATLEVRRVLKGGLSAGKTLQSLTTTECCMCGEKTRIGARHWIWNAATAPSFSDCDWIKGIEHGDAQVIEHALGPQPVAAQLVPMLASRERQIPLGALVVDEQHLRDFEQSLLVWMSAPTIETAQDCNVQTWIGEVNVALLLHDGQLGTGVLLTGPDGSRRLRMRPGHVATWQMVAFDEQAIVVQTVDRCGKSTNRMLLRANTPDQNAVSPWPVTAIEELDGRWVWHRASWHPGISLERSNDMATTLLFDGDSAVLHIGK